MSDPLFDEEDDAASVLTPDERQGLRLTYITTRRELNEAEQSNIADADAWAFSRRRKPEAVVDVDFLRRLHVRMLGVVWEWAGDYSQATDRRIGLNYWDIEPAFHALVADVRYWIENESFPPDEIALRFHHKLTWIHPFPNGNGRHARMAADMLAVALGQERFSWGGESLVKPKETRRRYVAALRAADNHDLGPLIDFARS